LEGFAAALVAGLSVAAFFVSGLTSLVAAFAAFAPEDPAGAGFAATAAFTAVDVLTAGLALALTVGCAFGAADFDGFVIRSPACTSTWGFASRAAAVGTDAAWFATGVVAGVVGLVVVAIGIRDLLSRGRVTDDTAERQRKPTITSGCRKRFAEVNHLTPCFIPRRPPAPCVAAGHRT
jgi:hypothetical protein